MYRFEWRRDTSHVSRYKFNENLVILKKKDIKSLRIYAKTFKSQLSSTYGIKSAYPSFSISSRGMKRKDAELMQ